MTKDELKKEVDEWLRSTDNHLNEEKTHFLSESEYAERAYLAGAEPREKRIAEFEAQIADLEKENAELKEKVNILDNCDRLGDMITVAYKDQLTKAKEIIKDLLGSENTCCEEEMFFEIRQKAEQFLKESEVEK